jgi:hypothetical protein
MQKRINKVSFKKSAASLAKFTRLFNAAAIAFAGGGIFGGLIRQTGDYEDSLFRMSETFQESSDIMIRQAKELSEQFDKYYDFNEIAYAFTKTADSMQRYGITGEKYIQLVARAADVGASKNLQLKESIDRIESAMRGEAEASEYLGLTLNDTYMKNIAFNGALKETWETMSDMEKTQHRFNELMEQSAKYSGAAERASNTLRGAYSSLWKTIKDDLNPQMIKLNGYLVTFANNVKDIVKEKGSLGALVELMRTLTPGGTVARMSEAVKKDEWSGTHGYYGQLFDDHVKAREKYLANLDNSKKREVDKTSAILKKWEDALYYKTDYRTGRAGGVYGESGGYEKMMAKAMETGQGLGKAAGKDSWQVIAERAQKTETAIEKSFNVMVSLSERTAWAMQQNFSDLFFDAMQGKLNSLKDYVTAFTDSIQRSIADVVGQQVVQGLFGQSFQGGGWLDAIFKPDKSYAGGGLIPEKVRGFGMSSGKSYEFHANERVVQGVGSGVSVDINVVNNLGQQAEVTQSSQWVRPDKMIAEVVLNKRMTSRSFRYGMRA